MEVVEPGTHDCDGDFLWRAGGLGWLYVGLGEAGGPEAPWWLKLLRLASHLDSKIS